MIRRGHNRNHVVLLLFQWLWTETTNFHETDRRIHRVHNAGLLRVCRLLPALLAGVHKASRPGAAPFPIPPGAYTAGLRRAMGPSPRY